MPTVAASPAMPTTTATATVMDGGGATTPGGMAFGASPVVGVTRGERRGGGACAFTRAVEARRVGVALPRRRQWAARVGAVPRMGSPPPTPSSSGATPPPPFPSSPSSAATATATPPPPPPPPPPPTDETTAAFNTWAATAGVSAPAATLSTFPSGLRGVMATAPIRTGATVVTVPRAAAFEVTTDDVRRSRLPGGVVPTDVWGKFPAWARLALLVAAARYMPSPSGVAEADEAKSGGGSTAAASAAVAAHDGRRVWLDAIGEVDVPLFWTDAELAVSEYPPLIKRVAAQRATLRRLYDSLSAGGAALADHLPYDGWLWAVAAVRSRAFSGAKETAPFRSRLGLLAFIAVLGVVAPAVGLVSPDAAANGALSASLSLLGYDLLFPRILRAVQGVTLSRTSLVPWVDMANHSGRVVDRADVSVEYWRDRYAVVAGEDVEPGGEVCISYGRQGNDALLQYFGFVEPANSWDDYTFSPAVGDVVAGVEGAREGAGKGASGKGFGGTPAVAPATARSGRPAGSPPPLKIRRDTGFAADVVATIGAADLATLCELELDRFSTSAAADEALLAAPGKLTGRRRTAVAFRLEKKQLLRETADALRATAGGGVKS